MNESARRLLILARLVYLLLGNPQEAVTRKIFSKTSRKSRRSQFSNLATLRLTAEECINSNALFGVAYRGKATCFQSLSWATWATTKELRINFRLVFELDYEPASSKFTSEQMTSTLGKTKGQAQMLIPLADYDWSSLGRIARTIG
ncbi:MAG: hypothetical protein WBR26_22660 [Candidatus Acidiferrum sp.]